MERSLARLRLALRRATELQVEVESWLRDARPTPVLKMSTDRRSIAVILEFAESPPAMEWAFLLGEWAHHLRSCLDNTVFEYVSDCSDHLPGRMSDIKFPLFRTKEHYDRIVARCLGPGLADLEPLVRSWQPFGVGEGEEFLQPGPGLADQHPLSLLSDLTNADKHRLPLELSATPAAVDFGTGANPFAIQFAGSTPTDAELSSAWNIEGAPLARRVQVLSFRSPHQIEAVKGAGGVQLQVGFATPSGAIALPVLLHGLQVSVGLLALRLASPLAPIDEVHGHLARVAASTD